MTASDTPTTADTVARLVADVLGLDRVPEPGTTLDDLRADSLDLVDLGLAAEDVFDIEIDDADLEDLRTVATVADLAALCDRKLGVAA